MLDGVTIYLVDNEQYFGDKIYRGGETLRASSTAFFCRAVLDAIPNLGFDAGRCCTATTGTRRCMPDARAHTVPRRRMQEQIKYLLTIHNIAFQGKFGFDFVQDMLDVDSRYYTPEFMELNGCADYLKAGCVFADQHQHRQPQLRLRDKNAATTPRGSRAYSTRARRQLYGHHKRHRQNGL